ncbi:cytochrome c [uncultured Variovorax sp.]|uniref:c-type cytochrome n=1 Tax=uncultured Variovorax sp. TaxID=114708 RepID=UPI0025E0DF03|nr:cytochrome c [uncultured Variovorax sp.]
MRPISIACKTGRMSGRAAAAVLALSLCLGLHASPTRAQSRGELLYNANCVACHNEKMHWRGRKLVNDWDSLEEQVRRWQQASSLGWRDQDIMEVARYLNDRFYGFEPPSATSLLNPAAAAPAGAGANDASPRRP